MERYHPGTAQGGLKAPDGLQTLDLGCFLGEIEKIMISSQQRVLQGWLVGEGAPAPWTTWMLSRSDPTGCLDGETPTKEVADCDAVIGNKLLSWFSHTLGFAADLQSLLGKTVQQGE